MAAKHHGAQHPYRVSGSVLSCDGAAIGAKPSSWTISEFFLGALGEVCKMTGWRVHAWVLMSNHYHLFIETPEPNLVTGMKWLQNTWTRRFNVRHRAWGRVFGHRYKAVPVYSEVDSRLVLWISEMGFQMSVAALPILVEQKKAEETEKAFLELCVSFLAIFPRKRLRLAPSRKAL
ncbi:MAG TPA: transposase, partial [Terrimicrobiaceae bacterium]